MRATDLLPIVEAGQDRFLSDLRFLVDLDCGSYTSEGVNRVADYCEDRFRTAGWTAVRHLYRPEDGHPQLGDCVVGTMTGGLAPEEGGKRFVMVGHMDTVFPEGTAEARPYRVDEDRAFGPGVNDMKSGLLSGFHAVEALREAGWDRFASIAFVCNPDEEIGSPFSKPIIQAEAKGADSALILEAARPDGSVVSSRKGVAEGTIELRGRAAHAGVEPEKGASAIVAGARMVLALQELNGRWDGVTVNTGVLQGGTRPNVVAERCSMVFDIRSPKAAFFDDVTAALRELVADPGDRITATLHFDMGFPPMERTEATAELVGHAREVAAELGIELTEAFTGGASDGNTTAGMGVPTLDGLGPVGGDPHSEAEWLDLTSIVPRATLLAGLIARLAG